MFLMLPLVLLWKGAAGTALLWVAPPARSGGEDGNLMLECSCMMWKAESLKWSGEKRSMHTHIFLVILANAQNIGTQYWRDLEYLTINFAWNSYPKCLKKITRNGPFYCWIFFLCAAGPPLLLAFLGNYQCFSSRRRGCSSPASWVILLWFLLVIGEGEGLVSYVIISFGALKHF